MVRSGGRGRGKYTTGTLLGTSRDRGWEGLLAERWRHSEGDLGEGVPEDTEVIVQLGGSLLVRRRGDGRLQHHESVPGTVYLCPAGIREDMIHLYGDVEESVHFYLPAGPLSTTALRELDADPDRVGLRYDGGFRDPLVEQIARSVCAEMMDPSPAGKLLVETLAAALRVQLLRRYANLVPASTRLPSARGALDPRRLDRVREYIDAHLGDGLSIEALAGQVHLSPYHFARAFKSATGTAPHRYVVERRVARAKALVEEGRLPLAAIADECGFSSQAHLTRWFKRVVGTTPGAFGRRGM